MFASGSSLSYVFGDPLGDKLGPCEAPRGVARPSPHAADAPPRVNTGRESISACDVTNDDDSLVNHPDRLRLLLDAIRAAQAPVGVKTRIVAVDGPGGSGKSSLASWLAVKLDAQVIHTDDFASWDNPTDWWPHLLELALEPLAAGRPARYQPTSWDGEERARLLIEPRGIVILEGVTASRQAFRPYLAYSIWVATSRELRLERGLERDGAHALPQWEQWMEAEDRYIETERPAEHADLVLPGDEDLWTG
jgi:uridine kinase